MTETKAGAKGVNGNIKTLGVILAIIVGVYGMISPMSQRIDYVEEQMNMNRARMEKHLDLRLHRGAAEAIAELAVTVVKVDSQSNALGDRLDGRLDALESWRIWWNRNILTSHTTLEEKVRNMECGPIREK